jgi:hypothetical protein
MASMPSRSTLKVKGTGLSGSGYPNSHTSRNRQSRERGAFQPVPGLWMNPASSIFGRKPIRSMTRLVEGVRDSPT